MIVFNLDTRVPFVAPASSTVEDAIIEAGKQGGRGRYAALTVMDGQASSPSAEVQVYVYMHLQTGHKAMCGDRWDRIPRRTLELWLRDRCLDLFDPTYQSMEDLI